MNRLKKTINWLIKLNKKPLKAVYPQVTYLFDYILQSINFPIEIKTFNHKLKSTFQFYL